MVEFAWQDAMSPRVARQENHFAPGKFAREQFIGRRTERGFDLHPFLVRESFKIVKPAAPDDADAML